MPKYHQNDANISDGVNLLISILVRYPEIGTINFDPQINSLKLTFMFSKLPMQTDFTNIKQLLMDSITAYHLLESTDAEIVHIELSTYGQMTMMNIIRDIHSLSKSEIALIITLLRENFQDSLIIDYNDNLLEEDLVMQEEVIDNMFASIKKQNQGNKLIGIREEGRVLVFNK
ncbi:hypothetical protein SDC9_06152 [bioreactor metagenome]|uniref:Uncharacterized protein n=1 Tax=bioreactor metagenome TaxID=1076179 RepID=A0A644T3S9_9ZZZZ|nr:hypothetical protein [Negativicutes bacterium]